MIKSNKGKLIIGFMSVFVVALISVIIMSSNASAATCTHYNRGNRYKAATCCSSGYTQTYCKSCGKIIYSKYYSALGHSYKAATCTSAKKCTRCGVTSGSALGHSYTAATCTSPKKCTRCGVTSGSPLIHKFAAATCTSPKKCTLCGVTSGSALGHSYTAATCTSSKKCTRCGVTSGSPLIHRFAAATCTSPKKCTLCGVKSGSSLGHSYTAATCTSPKKCTLCGVTSGSPLIHKFVAATCTSPKKCTLCGVTTGTALGHDYIEATCIAPKRCKRCHIVEGQPLNHYCTTTITKESTCVTTGTSVTTCTRSGCEYSLTKTIAATGQHTLDIINPNKTLPTCTKEGKIEFFCKDCGILMETVTIDKLGHDYQLVKLATFTTEGLKKCTKCAGTEIIPSTGPHTLDTANPKVTPATSAEAGKVEYFCRDCGILMRTVTIDEHVHTWYSKVTPATDTENGALEILCDCGEVKASETIDRTFDSISEEIGKRSDYTRMLGRLVIPDLDIDIAIFNPLKNNTPTIDAEDSAVYYAVEANAVYCIGDHNYQGFNKIMAAVPGETVAYIIWEDSVTTYISKDNGKGAIDIFSKTIVDEWGKPISDWIDTGLLMITCTEDLDSFLSLGTNRYYTIWVPIDEEQ